MISKLAFDRARLHEEPFPHFSCQEFIDEPTHNSILSWFESTAPWNPKSINDFCDLFELDLGSCSLPAELEFIRSAEMKESLCCGMEATFNLRFQRRVDLQAQKMTDGQRIRVHTDFGPCLQTHRIVIQFNKSWEVRWGGLLMLLKNPKSGEISPADCYYPPIPRLGIGFEISPRSHHAVSLVNGGMRFSLAYSFYCEGGYDRLAKSR